MIAEVMLKKLVLLVLLPTALLLAVLEGVGQVLLPWTDAERRTAAFNDRFYEYDPDLIVRLRPGLSDDFKDIRPDLDARVTINDAGFRGPVWQAPDEDAYRVLVLGDSVSFGLGVGDDETWPAVCAEVLRQRAPGKKIQVRNMAVPGYSTMQGQVMFERHVNTGDFRPHFVVFAFGFNDGFLRRSNDLRTRLAQQFLHESSAGQVRRVLTRHSRLCKWLWDAPPPTTTQDARCRVSQQQLRENLSLRSTRADGDDADVLLVDASLPHCYVRDQMRSRADEQGFSFLSFRDVFVKAKGLPAEGVWPDGGRLRVAVNTQGVPVPPNEVGVAEMSLLLVTTAGQRPTAVHIPLNDRGTRGDPVSGDGTWSCILHITPNARPELTFCIPGLVDQIPAMGSDPALLNGVHQIQPGPRPSRKDTPPPTLLVDAAAINQPPWPELVLVPDPIHPSPAGCRVLAAAVADVIVASGSWRWR